MKGFLFAQRLFLCHHKLGTFRRYSYFGLAMTIAFFDLDKTLIAKNSASLWLNNQWKAKQIKLKDMLRASFWLTKYHFGFTNLDDIIEKSLKLVQGKEEESINGETKRFYLEVVKKLYRPGALYTLHEHKKKNHITSLLTSSFEGLCDYIKDELSFDYSLCSRLEVNDKGLFTGRTIGPMCFGKNKVTYAQELCDKLGFKLKDCYFYTDSASDMPLLSLVGHPVVVNPDPRLRSQAKQKKWPIVDWGHP